MEGAPQIPEKEEKPKNSLGDKIKKWAKIGAVVGLGYIGGDKLEENTRISYLEENLKEGREQKIDSIVGVYERGEEFKYFKEELDIVFNNIERYKKKIEELKNKLSSNDVDYSPDGVSIKDKINLSEQNIEYLEKEVVPEIMAMSPDSVRNKILDAYKKYDEQHEWINKIVHSDEYKNRLEEEIGQEDIKKYGKYIEDVGKGLLSSRKHYLNSKDYNVLHGENVSDSHNTMAWFKHNKELVELPSNPSQGAESVGIHEFAHDLTYGGEFMTEKAKDLYTNSFDIEGAKKYLGNYATGENIIYNMEPTERDARKKVLEYDLEKLGVKKYGEVFTQEHYQKALELMKKGKLSVDSEEFIKMTKPEYFLQIMNEIAENQVAVEDNQNLT